VVEVPPDTLPFVDQLVQGVRAHIEELDGLLGRFAEHWSLERMAVVDRNVLRCALYELLYLDDIPAKVTINEAIEIAKRYGSQESGAFVNGILDRIVKSDARLQTKRLATA
jgi:N utilization substance protein B